MASWSEGEAFGELRSLMGRRPSAEAFGRVRELVDEAEEAAPGLYAERWRDYLTGSLARWPAATRSITLTSREEAEGVAQAPWSGLVHGVAIQRFLELKEPEHTRWLVEEFRQEMPWLEHIGFEYTLLRKKEIQRACDAGVFEGLTSLGFDECDLRVPTLDILLGHLDELGTLRRLAMTWCYMGLKQLERLLEAELIGQLEHLDLSDNRSFKVAGFTALADAAPRFAALRTLVLDTTEPPAKGMALIGKAAWPDTLERIGVRGNWMGKTGLKGFVDAGTLHLLFGRYGDEVALNLDEQNIGNRGVKLLAGCAELEQVEALSLSLGWVDAFDISPLVRSPHISALRAWSFRHTAGADGFAEDVLELVRRTRPRRIDLRGCVLDDAFVVALCGMEESSELESLLLRANQPYGLAALEAVASWPRLDALTRFECMFVVPSDADVLTSMYNGLSAQIRWATPEQGMATVEMEWRRDG